MGLTRISSKGQVVIPLGVRERLQIKEGETLAVSAEDDLIVLKKVSNPLEEDLETIEEIKEAWKEIEAGKYKKLASEEFLKEIEKW
ncbi:MAG: AbrB/MazE/SpoVT family DNA-binding domain-containing protein [Nanoarchaeota archaeon]|nr:AbrB/MazE/SpoVT family DNA-binding domain-containing protein [Nanoarchaeota archaeon]MBU0976911.1 AbrB/MazE/SpoVT family DNA-binding domain-containing protein [Nanoarchaeota archaeon]